MNNLIALIKKWIEQKKTGSIQINFYKGGISNINLKESIKLDSSFSVWEEKDEMEDILLNDSLN